MRQAACQYWVNHSEDKRMPTQKEIALTITEALGINRGENSGIPRKAKEYATAIQPEKYRDKKV